MVCCSMETDTEIEKLRKELKIAFKIINILHMERMDEGENWPLALEWMLQNEEFNPFKPEKE